MALPLGVATLSRAWASQVFARKPPSGDGGYDRFNPECIGLTLPWFRSCHELVVRPAANLSEQRVYKAD
jgi:hypothetical protein